MTRHDIAVKRLVISPHHMTEIHDFMRAGPNTGVLGVLDEWRVPSWLGRLDRTAPRSTSNVRASTHMRLQKENRAWSN